jgi:hypothetical protein
MESLKISIPALGNTSVLRSQQRKNATQTASYDLTDVGHLEGKGERRY